MFYANRGHTSREREAVYIGTVVLPSHYEFGAVVSCELPLLTMLLTFPPGAFIFIAICIIVRAEAIKHVAFETTHISFKSRETKDNSIRGKRKVKKKKTHTQYNTIHI